MKRNNKNIESFRINVNKDIVKKLMEFNAVICEDINIDGIEYDILLKLEKK